LTLNKNRYHLQYYASQRTLMSMGLGVQLDRFIKHKLIAGVPVIVTKFAYFVLNMEINKSNRCNCLNKL
jgi:hypothetical protein